MRKVIDVNGHPNTPPWTFRALKNLIETQIAFETHNEEDQKYRFENLTVAELLEMLEYMSWD